MKFLVMQLSQKYNTDNEREEGNGEVEFQDNRRKSKLGRRNKRGKVRDGKICLK
jgi:hypothetical protein